MTCVECVRGYTGVRGVGAVARRETRRAPGVERTRESSSSALALEAQPRGATADWVRTEATAHYQLAQWSREIATPLDARCGVRVSSCPLFVTAACRRSFSGRAAPRGSSCEEFSKTGVPTQGVPNSWRHPAPAIWVPHPDASGGWSQGVQRREKGESSAEALGLALQMPTCPTVSGEYQATVHTRGRVSRQNKIGGRCIRIS